MDKIVERVITEGCFVESMVLPNLEDQEMPLTAASEADGSEEALLAEDLRRRYASTSTATDLSFPIPPPAGTSPDMGFGTLTVPGWVRGRVAEVLFEGDPIAEAVPIPDVILQCILKVSPCFTCSNCGAKLACSCPRIFVPSSCLRSW